MTRSGRGSPEATPWRKASDSARAEGRLSAGNTRAAAPPARMTERLRTRWDWESLAVCVVSGTAHSTASSAIGYAGSGKITEKSAESLHSWRSEEHTSELQSRENLVCRLLLEKKK